MGIAILIDFGSTHTKVLAVDIDDEEILGRAQAVTTVEKDITIGLNLALKKLFTENDLKESDITNKYACSSAAGGLRMAAIGLVPALTLEAARRAALGAGAKVIWSSGYELDELQLQKIEDNSPDIILLTGGTDGGDRKVILHNAELLAESNIQAHFLVAGNRSVVQKVKIILDEGGKNAQITHNVLPEVDRLDIEPAQALIRNLFIKQITEAKGLNKAQNYIGDIVMPTPSATLQAATLLADGTENESGIGSLLVVEVGGATINIHSVAEGQPSNSNIILRGLPEARIKRTVEGDLGIRYNAPSILEFVGSQVCLSQLQAMAADVNLNTSELTDLAQGLSNNVGHVPNTDFDFCLDRVLAESAVAFAVERHVGTLRQEFSLAGEIKVQKGKDLTQVNNIIGTGGIFKYGRAPEEVLCSALFDPQKPWSLKPISPTAYIDRDYLLYGIGLLAEDFPDKALRIAKRSMVPACLNIHKGKLASVAS
ncbi:methylaspartate mutase accessory protein GlmL [Desulfotignum balticum]|uniref:methylaspartate mutase accessory protein GlmL n=1 Tax=Desulfotignum balticum TaxID=115781 RepID=UPI00040D6442|nr:methylaspartate mutase accessory protein GlmL [Desulfotignum balticum]